VPAEPQIAIIDDDESMRIGLVMLLRAAGYDARSFASAEEFLALEPGRLRRFACIVADVQMTGLSGIELKRRLSAEGYLSPVIMITARNEAGLEEGAIAAGAASFLRKPVDAAVLIQCLERALKA